MKASDIKVEYKKLSDKELLIVIHRPGEKEIRRVAKIFPETFSDSLPLDKNNQENQSSLSSILLPC